VDVTAVQQRTLDRLIGNEPRPVFPADVAQGLRDRIEDAVRGLDLSEPLWLGKDRLNDLTRCEGKLAAAVLGETEPFAHSRTSAIGTLLHRAIELEVGARDETGAQAVAAKAAERLSEDDPRFATYWRRLDQLDQDDHLLRVLRRLTHFRGSFPPLREIRTMLAPVAELRVRAELLGGALVLSGQVDLVLGRPDPLAPGRASRLVIDLKSGGAYPEYPEDMRFYALLMTLRFGVPPYRVASFFLESGEWQSEDVDERTLHHAADRVIAAARSSAALRGGRPPELRPGRHCAWCGRAATCPESLALVETA
jgi:PD-(D/E)XK nuclease superfamily